MPNGIPSLDYEFRDETLLQYALTHRSAGKNNNERLEFLGDAILNFVIAEHLYQSCPGLPEGDLSRLRASLVNKTSLSEIAQKLALGDSVILGPGEMKSGGQRRDSILADTLEAIIGAIYLDGGFGAAQAIIRDLYTERFANLPMPDELKDAKTRLQELLQARGLGLPEYKVMDVQGKDHAQTFLVTCHVTSLDLQAQGTGRSRRAAEQNAAQAVMAIFPQ